MSKKVEDFYPGLADGWNFKGNVSVGGSLTITSLINTGTSVGSKANTVDQTTATVTLTAAQSGSVILLDKSDGITVTLPASVVGLRYTFLYVLDQASSATAIQCPASSFFKGGINILVANSATSKGFIGNGSTHTQVTSNATTTGGLSGGSLEVRCITATQWSADGQLVGSGGPATPFST